MAKKCRRLGARSRSWRRPKRVENDRKHQSIEEQGRGCPARKESRDQEQTRADFHKDGAPDQQVRIRNAVVAHVRRGRGDGAELIDSAAQKDQRDQNPTENQER